MISKNPIPTRDRCECGAHLAWESRETRTGKRWLALCSSPACGVITPDSPRVAEPENRLQAFLLGEMPAVRYLQPWTRFYFRSSGWGYTWCPHVESCRDCGNELVVALDIEWRPDRRFDPCHVALCVQCGSTETTFWMEGERVGLWTSGSAWDDLTPPIQALRRALSDRARERQPGYEWDFNEPA